MPVVIENVPKEELGNLSAWSLAGLAASLHKPVPVKFQAKAEFVYLNSEMPLGGEQNAQRFGALPSSEPYRHVLASLSTILNDAQWPADGSGRQSCQSKYLHGAAVYFQFAGGGHLAPRNCEPLISSQGRSIVDRLE